MTFESKYLFITAAMLLLPAGGGAIAQTASRGDEHGAQETKPAPVDMRRLLPVRVGLKWRYDATTVSRHKRHAFDWTLQCVQAARSDSAQVGLFVHDYQKVKHPRSTPEGTGRLAVAVMPTRAWFIRLPDVKPPAKPTLGEEDLLALAEKLRKSVAEDKMPEGLTVIGLLTPAKPNWRDSGDPPGSLRVYGMFLAYPPWAALPDPRLKHLKPQPEGKLSTWMNHDGRYFRAWGLLQPGVGLLDLSWFTPNRRRDLGYWLRLKRSVAERAKLLKANIGRFSLTLKHLNPHGPNIRPVVRLTVAAMGGRIATWRISKAQAVKLIDHLAAEGFLASSRNIFRTPADEITGPCCVLSVGGPMNVSFEENLGWDLKMIERLDALRKVLDGKAGKAMDELLRHFELRRVKWTGRDIKQLRVQKFGNWSYELFLAHASTRSRQTVGIVTFKGVDLIAAKAGDYLWTPWGKLIFWRERYMLGWLPAHWTSPQPKGNEIKSPDAATSDLVETRYAALRAGVKKLTVDIRYHGKGGNASTKNGDGPYRWLALVTPSAPRPSRAFSDGRFVNISEPQAERIIDRLTAEGFLAEAQNIGAELTKRPTGPTYTLEVSGSKKGMQLHQILGWDLKMLKRLDALRKVLDGDAAKEMDKLLKALEPRRKEWQKTAAGKAVAVRWDKAVNGLVCGISAFKTNVQVGVNPSGFKPWKGVLLSAPVEVAVGNAAKRKEP